MITTDELLNNLYFGVSGRTGLIHKPPFAKSCLPIQDGKVFGPIFNAILNTEQEDDLKIFVKNYFYQPSDCIEGELINYLGGKRFPGSNIVIQPLDSTVLTALTDAVKPHNEKHPVVTLDEKHTLTLEPSGYLKYSGNGTEEDIKRLKDFLASLTVDEHTKSALINVMDNLKLKQDARLARTFVGDLLWLYYFDLMGVHKILGKILTDFEVKGQFPINAQSALADKLQGLISLIKMGTSSRYRDRVSAYQRCLGWMPDEGKDLKPNIRSQINNGFAQNFHSFLFWALEYYNSKKLPAVLQANLQGTTQGSIQGSISSGASVSILPNVSTAITLLKQSLKQFDFGSNHTTTVTGIAWTIAGMYLVRELKLYLGISYDDISEYMTSAYLVLVEGKPATISDTNRYINHKECAENGRDILSSLETLNHTDSGPGGELEDWLCAMQNKIEQYQSAHFRVTGVDFSKRPKANI